MGVGAKGLEITNYIAKPVAATLIVAASDSLHPERADYVCDGVDDQVQIQAAIDALPASGGSIVLLEGNYLTSDHILLNDNVSFSGIGWGTTIKAKDGFGTKTVLHAYIKSNIHIKDIQIDGNFANNPRNTTETSYAYGIPNDDQNGIWLYHCNDCIVESCYVHDTPDNGIAATQISRNILIHGNIVTGAQWHSIELWDDVALCRVIANYVEKGGDIVVEMSGTERNMVSQNIVNDPRSYCFSIWYSPNIIVDSNMFIGSGVDFPQVRIYTQAAFPVHGLIFSNNLLLSGKEYGIKFSTAGGGDVTESLFIGNTITDLEDYGFLFEADCSDVRFIDNLIARADGGFHLAEGFTFARLSFISNTVRDIVNWSIYNLKGSDHLISNNMFKNIHGDKSSAIYSRQYSDLFMDVLAVSATHVRSNEDLSEAIPNTFTIDAQPDVPRTLSGHFDAHAQITAYTIVITGVDAKGNTVTETFTEAASPWDFETANAYATITSIIMSARTGTGAGDTMDIGITDVLGLSNIIYETGDVFKIKKNNGNAVVAAAQVDVDYDTYDFSVIGLAGGDDFTIWFRSNLNIIS